jgi:hypothetical protein
MTVKMLAKSVKSSLTEGEGSGSTLRLVHQFIMDLTQSKDPSVLVRDPPASTGDPRWDAMIAGVVEDFAIHHGMPAPKWVFDPCRFLDTWWFFTSIQDMRPTAIVETPAALSGRGVFIQRASLVNV